MKIISRIILAILITINSIGIVYPQEAKENFTLRFIDKDSLTPIVSEIFILIPRRILLQDLPDSPNPNLEFAKEVITNKKGYVDIEKKLIDELASDGKFIIDCKSKTNIYANFNIQKVERNWGISYTITVFTTDGRVNGTMYLYNNQPTVIVLEKNKNS